MNKIAAQGGDNSAGARDYFGPSGFCEMRGWPVKVSIEPRAQDSELAKRLWEISETLTGVHY